MENLKIFDGTKRIEIRTINDLCKLPDKSIKLLFENKNYATILYLYVMYKFDMCLESKKYSYVARLKYYNLCLKNLDSLVEFEKEFLVNSSTDYVIEIKEFPKEIQKHYLYCLVSVCNFFSGMLATTSYLDKKLYSRVEKQIVRHNYGNMVSTLLNTVENTQKST